MNPPSTRDEVRIDPSQWVDKYGDYLFRYAYSRLRETDAAEEVVQETFFAGIRFQNQFSGRGSERAWLLGILKRKIVDFVRLRSRYGQTNAPEDEHDPSGQLFDEKGNWRHGVISWSSAPEKSVEYRELWEVLQGCLNHLPRGQADVFVLSVMEDMDADEICRELEISPTNLYVRLHRARLGLAKCINARWFGASEEPSHAQ